MTNGELDYESKIHNITGARESEGACSLVTNGELDYGSKIHNITGARESEGACSLMTNGELDYESLIHNIVSIKSKKVMTKRSTQESPAEKEAHG